MAFHKLRIRITGTRPLLMHNGDLADPLNEHTKALKVVTGKRKKTEADFEKMQHLEFIGGLNLDEKLHPCIKGDQVEGFIRDAARQSKKGKDVERGVVCLGNFPLEYDGPKDPEALWKTGKYSLRTGIRIKKSRVMRVRPKFDKWSAVVDLEYSDAQFSEEELLRIMTLAGEEVGVGDWRPKFGLFKVKKVTS